MDENKDNNLTEDDIKQEIISIIYGNTFTKLNSKFITDLSNEIIIITKYFTDANPEILKKIINNKTKKKKTS